MGAPRALACPPTCRPRLQTGSVCRQPTAEAALFWENVGELTMDREIREQIAQRAYALCGRLRVNRTVGMRSTGTALRARSQPRKARTPP